MSKTKSFVMCAALFILTTVNCLADPQKSQALVAEAWKAWSENNQQLTEAKLVAAVKEDPNNARAYLGLYLLYGMQGKDQKAWESLKVVLQNKETSYPYIFTVMGSSGVFRQQFDSPNSEAITMLEAMSKSADPEGILKAMANEALGIYYQDQGDLVKSARYFQNQNSIKDWLVLGPFENISASGIEKVFPPESEFATGQTYPGKNGIPAKWFRPSTIKRDQWIDFSRYFVAESAIFYANTFVYSPKKQTVQLRVGTSGSVKVFLNDQQLFEYLDENNNDLDTYVIETELQEGWNRVLIKCGMSEIESCNFMLRVTDRSGEPISGLEVSTESKTYPRRPGASVKVIENFAEAFFKAKIKENPDYLENYALLAECYLRNDKATEAELVLRQASARASKCALFDIYLVEAYRRGEKSDEISTVYERINSADPNIPQAIVYQINTHFANKEFDKAEELIKKYEKLRPESEELYDLKLALYEKKNLVDQSIATNQKAFKLYPSNWSFVYGEAAYLVDSTQKYDRAISLIEKYMAKNYDYSVLKTLAGFYLQSSNVKKWQEYYNKLLELDPAASTTYWEMSEVFFKQQDYTQAEKMVRKALELCPNSSVYWSRVGEIQRIRKETAAAKESYREALKYHPQDYEALTVLRELEGKPSVFTLFPSEDIKQLIAKAPAATAYPESGGVILLQDIKRVIYPGGGASEINSEVLIKVFNKRGIDDFKEYYIPFNSFSQTLTVEKAVVTKPNGTEIKADTNFNHLVFKSLEDNDTIYIKWNVRNYQSGQFFRDFWDTQYFNTFYPSKITRYSLLAPRDYQFKISAQNMPAEPVKKETDAGTIHQWMVQDEPGVVPEVGMPPFADVAKILHLSSVSEWSTIVSWYTDMAQTKTKSSYEIKELIEQLFAAKKNATEEEKIETVYNFITENIRYSSVSFRQSGLIPQKARDVLVNKIGDCKDVATLCITMLNEIGIRAHYVLVNTRDAGQGANVLPAILFNHCIVAVETSSGLKYLDLTAHNYPIGSLPAMDVEALSLLIKPGVKNAGPLPADQVAKRHISHQSKMEIKNDMSVSLSYKSDWQGEASTYLRQIFRDKGPEERQKIWTNIIATQLPGVRIDKLDFVGLDGPKPSTQVISQFEAANYLSEAGQFKLLKLPWLDRIAAAPAQKERKFPYNYWPYADKIEERIEVRLPEGYEPLELSKDVKLSSSAADYSIKYSFADGVITISREIINKKSVIAISEYADFQQFCRSVQKADDSSILLKSVR
jgi:tetratricopeptide (TPR) repeat protein